MKVMRSFRGLFRASLIGGAVLFTTTENFAQTPNASNTIPTVTISATQPLATWTGQPGIFTVTRTGDPTPTLNVFYTISGTASNGVDYQMIGNFLLLTNGELSNNIVIQPSNLGQTDIKTVTLQLTPSPLASPGIPVNYVIGTPRTATVFITPPGVTNIPPMVNITTPANGSDFPAGTDIQLIAEGSDTDGYVTGMAFYAGSNLLGIVTNAVIVDPPPPPGDFVPGTRAFFLTWSNAPAGQYALTAIGTANNGLSTVSPPVNIVVGPISNLPPVVRITSPPNNAVFHAPVTLPIFAYAHDPAGSIASVQYFDGTNSLGFGNPISAVPVSPVAYSTPVSPGPIPDPLPPIILPPTNLFVLVWSNVPVGAHFLTAVATDNSGTSTTSDPVKITVLPPTPPINLPDVVTIVATEPVAIAGTNWWPWLGLAGTNLDWADWTAASPVCRVFTNFGPKDAVFTVRRFGEITNDINVAYGIGGTASNGVDYVTLPGVVTIPTGERTARITVVPLNTNPPPIKTVILTLTPKTSYNSDYLVGIPSRAAAVILDGPPWPVTPAAVLPDKCFYLGATGPDGAWFHIEYSDDLKNWTPICTNQVFGGLINFVDPDAQTNSARCYRAVPESTAPLQ
jgi:Bacterial Ig domain